MSAPGPGRELPEGSPLETGERLSTGVDGLDYLLEGGLLRGNSLLIEGPPGSGKSTLATRIVHEGIVRHDEPALIIAFEEFPRQIYREALGQGIDLRRHEEAGRLRVLWTPPQRILEGFQGRSDLLDRIVEETGVRRLVIDSITHFKRVASSELELRELLSTVLSNLKLKGVSSFLVKETEDAAGAQPAFEEYLVDASLRLYHDPACSGPPESSRLLEVRKTRGQGHVGGRHPFELGTPGLWVYPRLDVAAVERLLGDPEAPAGAGGPLGFGLEGLDDMLGGGLAPGTLTLLTGASGAGKSLLARRWLEAGERAGERGFALRVEQGGQARPNSLRVSPYAWSFPKLLGRVLHELRGRRLRRLVLDGLDVLEPAGDRTGPSAQELATLAAVARGCGAGLLVTLETLRPEAERFAATSLRLEASPEDENLRRSLRVLKHVAAVRGRSSRDYSIGTEGLRL